MSQKTVTRAYRIEFPEQLRPTYDFLQKELNRILANPNWVQKIDQIPLRDKDGRKVLNGTIWKEMEYIIFDKVVETFEDDNGVLKTTVVKRNNFTEHWNLGGNAWYLRIILENIRRTKVSLQEKREIFEITERCEKVYDKKGKRKITEEIRNALTKANLYPTNKDLQNLLAYGKYPEFPKEVVLTLDYSVSDSAILKKLGDNKFQIRVNKDTWIDYNVVLHSSLREGLTGKISNPNFRKRKYDGKYIGACPYEIVVPEYQETGNILGVDIGFVKQYAAVVLLEDGTYSKEYCNSKYLKELYEKLKRMYNSQKALEAKIERCVNEPDVDKQHRRSIEYLNTKEKIKSLKETIMKQSASELVELAVKTDCNLIRVENLGVMKSKTGKWNYGVLHKSLQEIGELFGIRVEKINPKDTSKKHPLTGSKGEVKGRKIIFEDGTEVDRDYLGAINVSNTPRYNSTFKQKVTKMHTEYRKEVNQKHITNRQIAKNRIKAVKDAESEISLNSEGPKIRAVFNVSAQASSLKWTFSRYCSSDSDAHFHRNKLTLTNL